MARMVMVGQVNMEMSESEGDTGKGPTEIWTPVRCPIAAEVR